MLKLTQVIFDRSLRVIWANHRLLGCAGRVEHPVCRPRGIVKALSELRYIVPEKISASCRSKVGSTRNHRRYQSLSTEATVLISPPGVTWSVFTPKGRSKYLPRCLALPIECARALEPERFMVCFFTKERSKMFPFNDCESCPETLLLSGGKYRNKLKGI